MVVEGSGAVRAGGGDLAVGMQGERPAPPVHDDEVVERADRSEVAKAGRPATGPGDVVVDLAERGGHPAAWICAVLMAGEHRTAEVGRNGRQIGRASCRERVYTPV